MHPRDLIEPLGLALLAAIGVMAVSASAAQAKYLLLLNKVSVTNLNVNENTGGGHKMVAENGLSIECKGGKGTAQAESVEGGAKIAGSASHTFESCVWIGSKKTARSTTAAKA